MAGSAPTSAAAVDVSDLNLAEAAMAFGNFAARRAQRVASIASEVASGRKRPGEIVVEALDGNEADLEELSLRWRLAGVRWPILILMALAFVGGVNAGRRGRR
jgi:hypothetical protein